MKKLYILICIFSIVGSASYANPFGGYDAGTLNSQTMRDLRTHEFATREKNKSAIVQKTTKLEQQMPDIPIASTIKTVRFINNNSISASDLTRVISPLLNKPATEQNIAAIRKQIIKYYQANGYYSAIAFPNTTNLKAGELIFEIKEGGKNSIVIQQ